MSTVPQVPVASRAWTWLLGSGISIVGLVTGYAWCLGRAYWHGLLRETGTTPAALDLSFSEVITPTFQVGAIIWNVLVGYGMSAWWAAESERERFEKVTPLSWPRTRPQRLILVVAVITAVAIAATYLIKLAADRGWLQSWVPIVGGGLVGIAAFHVVERRRTGFLRLPLIALLLLMPGYLAWFEGMTDRNDRFTATTFSTTDGPHDIRAAYVGKSGDYLVFLAVRTIGDNSPRRPEDLKARWIRADTIKSMQFH